MVTGTLHFFVCMVAGPAFNQLDQLPPVLYLPSAVLHTTAYGRFLQRTAIGHRTSYAGPV